MYNSYFACYFNLIRYKLKQKFEIDFKLQLYTFLQKKKLFYVVTKTKVKFTIVIYSFNQSE